MEGGEVKGNGGNNGTDGNETEMADGKMGMVEAWS
jgi:hypothetical protein